MADKLAKVVGEHLKDCGAVAAVKRGDWPHPWGPIAYAEHGEPTVHTWRRYGKKGKTLRTWVRFVCNHHGCKAELHVEADFILAAASDGDNGVDK